MRQSLAFLQVLGVLPTLSLESWKSPSVENRELQAEDTLAEEYLEFTEEFYGVSSESGIDPEYVAAMEEFYGETYVDPALSELEYQLFLEEFTDQ